MFASEETPTDRVPYKEDSPNEAQESLPEPQKVFEGARSFMDDVSYHKVSEFFDIAYDERRDSGLFEKINLIQEWAAAQSNSKDQVDVLNEINTLRKKLGLQMKGKELVVRIHRYIRLSMDKERLEKEMKLAIA